MSTFPQDKAAVSLHLSLSAKQVNDDDDDAEEADSVFDFAAPVKSFLDRSRRQMESYFGVEKREHEGTAWLPDLF